MRPSVLATTTLFSFWFFVALAVQNNHEQQLRRRSLLLETSSLAALLAEWMPRRQQPPGPPSRAPPPSTPPTYSFKYRQHGTETWLGFPLDIRNTGAFVAFQKLELSWLGDAGMMVEFALGMTSTTATLSIGHAVLIDGRRYLLNDGHAHSAFIQRDTEMKILGDGKGAVAGETGVETLATVCDAPTSCTKFTAAGVHSVPRPSLSSIRATDKVIVWLASSDGTLLDGPYTDGEFVFDTQSSPVDRLVVMYVNDALNSFVHGHSRAAWLRHSLPSAFSLTRPLAGGNATRLDIIYSSPEAYMHGINDVTLVTQFSGNRVRRFVEMLRSWAPYAVSAVMFAQDGVLDVLTLLGHLALLEDVQSSSTRLQITVIQPATRGAGGGVRGSRFWSARYPINMLRNIGILNVQTPYFMNLDVDFVPSGTLAAYANRVVAPTATRYASERRTRDDAMMFDVDEHTMDHVGEARHKLAFVLPAIGLKGDLNEYPRTFSALEYLWTHGDHVQEFEGSGHDATKLHRLLGPRWLTFWPSTFDLPAYSSRNVVPLEQDFELFSSHGKMRGFSWQAFGDPFGQPQEFAELCFEHQWEPYYILRTDVQLSLAERDQWSQYWEGVLQYIDQADMHMHEVLDPASLDAFRRWTTNDRLMSRLLFDPRFENQGGDKQSHTLLLNQFKFRFLQVKKEFVVHLSHDDVTRMRKGRRGERRIGNDDDDDENNDDDHTAATATSFTYFEHFLPQMERLFGKSFRWGAECPYHWLYEQQRFTAV